MSTPTARSAQVFTRTLSNRLDEIATLADALELWGAIAQVPPATLQAVNLMLDELITNVVMHGYPATHHGEIFVNVCHSTGRLDVELRDYAMTHNPLSAAEPDLESGIEDRAIGGLGVHFVRKLADEVTYERANEDGREINLVRIIKLYPKPDDTVDQAR